ncbi:MAG TPA: adenosine-specific kinase [Candidatus Mcinerneyibacterium sp.]|nr:adenosine-specific kinase [Candidatus Mcinerneyibacterium sp.]
MEIREVKIEKKDNLNIILGQSHFIKTVEDLYEVMAQSSPSAKFGIAFNEASGDRLIRYDGNDDKLINMAIKNMKKIGAGHSFIIVMDDIFPINCLNQIKDVPEVCRIFAATANPISVIVTENKNGCGIVGVIDGYSPVGVENEEKKKERKALLRNIGYKR